jgi:hypothetical protein
MVRISSLATHVSTTLTVSLAWATTYGGCMDGWQGEWLSGCEGVSGCEGGGGMVVGCACVCEGLGPRQMTNGA